jgi:hypothetical protein
VHAAASISADAGDSDDRIGELEYPLDIFDGNSLTEMGFFHPAGNQAAAQASDEPGRLLETVNPLGHLCKFAFEGLMVGKFLQEF